MKLAFSTLGCPEWPVDQIIANALRLGYAGIGIRGLQGEMDFSKMPAFSPAQRAATRKKFADAGLDVYILLSSARFSSPDSGERAANLEQAERVMDLASYLGSKLVRVFGGKIAAGVDRQAAYGWVADSLKRLGDYGAKAGVIAVLELHDDFTSSTVCRELMRRVDHPWVKLLWDVHHPFRSLGEGITETWNNIGQWVWDTHFKDSVPDPGQRLGHRYTLLGEGGVPNIEALRILKNRGYRGYLCLEWEKVWHPYLADASIAFPHYASKMREYLSSLG